eukprot:CAMPEP_0185038636 /NCGR_PEP_ID=MMETSP1103-20130426/34526_1 /TAXON_ID=36769 /ORGANISM="Paraphysomonas bandaiensis, Strain Caron Lab Isolate" /LENGTH=199 /DNA_ID=CAMNT_0027577157 /DNA_START=60 /DNA_END=655 /DNA_ORIENTATION=-
MAVQLVGRNLEQICARGRERCSLQTVLSVGIQLINLLERLHNTNYIHGDLKPNNIAVGTGEADSGVVYLIDLGDSREFASPESGIHVSYQDGQRVISSLRYASLNVLLGLAPTRRDDMESLGYSLISCLRPLPWHHIPGSSRASKIRHAINIRADVTVSQLCSGLPGEFQLFMSHVKGLGYSEQPNYVFLRQLLIGAMA